jgi:hypothetical protein
MGPRAREIAQWGPIDSTVYAPDEGGNTSRDGCRCRVASTRLAICSPGAAGATWAQLSASAGYELTSTCRFRIRDAMLSAVC